MKNENVIIAGTSGLGKSTNYIQRDLLEEVGRRFILLLDPQYSSAVSLLNILLHQYPRVLVDDLRRKDRVIPVPLLESTGDEIEDRKSREDVLEVLYRATEELGHEHPLKTYYADKALMLYQRLPEEWRKKLPLRIIVHLFDPMDEWHDALTVLCEDLRLARMFWGLQSLHPATRLDKFGPSQRLLESVLLEPALMARDTGGGPDIEQLVRERWVVMICGGSQEAFRMVAAAWSRMVFRFFEDSGNAVGTDCLRGI